MMSLNCLASLGGLASFILKPKVSSLQLGRWLPAAPGLLNQTLVTTWREVCFLKFVCLSEGDSDSCLLCLAPGPISVSGRTRYYFIGSDWILFPCPLPGRKRRTEMEAFTGKMGVVKMIGC